MSKKRILYIVLGLLVLIQFFQIDKTNPPVQADKDFLKTENPPTEIAVLLSGACYDCHSHQTQYPWYTSIQPVGWFVRSHYRGGRMNVNFSEWTDYSETEKTHKLEEAIEVIGNKRMPMKSYAFMHKPAKLSDNDRATLISWLREAVKK